MDTLARPLFCVFLLGVSGVLGAAEPRGTSPPAAVAPPPPLENRAPVRAPNLGEIEPEITITSKGTEIHEEYRHNGQLYMVKVTPAIGPPYYLIYDERGFPKRSDVEPDVIIPTWIIKRF